MTYSTGLAADRSGFSLDTLRYCERIGLLYDTERTTGGQRVFSDDLEWLGVLRCPRDTGMPIATMQRYASSPGTANAPMPKGSPPCCAGTPPRLPPGSSR
jgi:DNA-binding transcriptional MerR regulator